MLERTYLKVKEGETAKRFGGWETGKVNKYLSSVIFEIRPLARETEHKKTTNTGNTVKKLLPLAPISG